MICQLTCLRLFAPGSEISNLGFPRAKKSRLPSFLNEVVRHPNTISEFAIDELIAPDIRLYEALGDLISQRQIICGFYHEPAPIRWLAAVVHWWKPIQSASARFN